MSACKPIRYRLKRIKIPNKSAWGFGPASSRSLREMSRNRADPSKTIRHLTLRSSPSDTQHDTARTRCVPTAQHPELLPPNRCLNTIG
ncbi:hypothetical protein T06_12877 [Trichinella sp. T6]|nr:hypothetical protein T06_12877 [Trichinella sp. T6]